MAIGSTITISVPTVGTTAYTLNKAEDGRYLDVSSITNSNGDVIPITLELRKSTINGSRRNINMVLRHRPAAFDSVLGVSQGQITCSLQVSANLGDDISQTDIVTYVQYLGSVLAQSAVVTPLLESSYA